MGNDAKGRHEAESPALPAIAEPDAAGKVGKGISDRLSSSLDNSGKALSAVAGVGVFFFAAGYFVQWQRFRRGGLPPEELLAMLPKGQIAAAGVTEVFISLVILGWGLVAIAGLTQDRSGGLGGFVNRLFSRELLFPTVVVGVLTFLVVP